LGTWVGGTDVSGGELAREEEEERGVLHVTLGPLN
jgi:hypothetical protein